MYKAKYQVIIKVIFIVFKYVILILQKENTFSGDLAYICGIWREAELFLGIWEANAKYF